jgi:hypothetical protein
MKIEKAGSRRFLIECNANEMMILSNGLNNIAQAVSDGDHGTLIGGSKQEVAVMLDQLVAAQRD